MTYPTHKQCAISFAFLVAILIHNFSLSGINYYISLPILILTAKYGGLFPDIDHTWANVKEKTIPNLLINKLIHLTGGRHRSWQTHSIDIVIAFTIVSNKIPQVLYERGIISAVDKEVLWLILLGFISGWVSHIVSDMFTSAGVRLVCWGKYKVRLVPKSIGSLRFNTGHEWEEFVYRVVKTLNIALGFICIIYPIVMGV